MSTSDDLKAQAERLAAAGALGRSAPIQKLFDYLLARSLQGEAPKEIEVAQAVFGRAGGFDVSQDSTVRVYVHRLRRKLDDYYAGPGREEPVRLAIPKGEYRLVTVSRDIEQALTASAPRSRLGWLRPWMLIAVAALLVLNLVDLGAGWLRASQDSYAFARRAPGWAEVLDGDRPITVVVGDYYIFGEADDHRDVVRLIREYGINSPEDLANHQMEHPELVDRYADLDLYYLPVSIAPAMRNLLPLLAPSPSKRERVRVVTASQLTPDMLKRNDIVYIGYFSGLGLLRDTVFGASRFRVGETYDELIDQKTGKHYLSQEGGPDQPGETRRDYGYFSSFTGPEGNRVVVVAGARDVGVMQTAEAVASREGLAALKKALGGSRAFEALYEVQGVGRVNLRGALVLTSPISASRAYDAPLAFPAN